VPTFDELAALYAEQGVDPTLASVGDDFLGNLSFEDVGMYAPYSLAAMSSQSSKGTGSLFPDPSLSMAASSISNLSRNVEVLTQSIDRLLNNIQRTNDQTSNSVNSLIQLQAQTQENISRSQITPQYAQVVSPQAFGMAPSLEYQISPQGAIFRTPIQAGRTALADRPQSSFMSDLMMRSSFYRENLYEPTFAEDPYMSVVNARARMQERILTAQNTMGTVGTQIGAGAASLWGLGKAGQALGISANLGLKGIAGGALRFMGGPVGWADLALNLAGLPSISGAVGEGAEALYGATAGRYFTGMDMSRDITKATRFYTGAGSGVTGQGLSKGRASQVVSGLQGLQAQDYVLNVKDYMGIFTEAADQGLMSMAGNEEDMLRNVKTISKNLRLFMRISGDSDYRNAIKSMGDLFRMGVPLENLQSAGANISNFARMAGVSYQQASTFGAQGAMAYQQAGASIGLGYQTGVMGRAMSRLAVQGGGVRAGVLARFGGEEGLGQTLTETMGAFMGGPVGQMMLAGFLGDGDQMGISRQAVERFGGGGMSFEGLLRRGRENISGREEQFFNRQWELQDQLSQVMGAAGQPLMALRVMQEVMQRGNVGYESAARMMFGERGGRAFTTIYNRENLGNIVGSMRVQDNLQEYNRRQGVLAKDFFQNRVITGIKGTWHDLVGRRIDRYRTSNATQEEYERGMEMGVYRADVSGMKELKGYDMWLGALPKEEQSILLRGGKRAIEADYYGAGALGFITDFSSGELEAGLEDVLSTRGEVNVYSTAMKTFRAGGGFRDLFGKLNLTSRVQREAVTRYVKQITRGTSFEADVLKDERKVRNTITGKDFIAHLDSIGITKKQKIEAVRAFYSTGSIDQNTLETTNDILKKLDLKGIHGSDAYKELNDFMKKSGLKEEEIIRGSMEVTYRAEELEKDKTYAGLSKKQLLKVALGSLTMGEEDTGLRGVYSSAVDTMFINEMSKKGADITAIRSKATGFVRKAHLKFQGRTPSESTGDLLEELGGRTSFMDTARIMAQVRTKKFSTIFSDIKLTKKQHEYYTTAISDKELDRVEFDKIMKMAELNGTRVMYQYDEKKYKDIGHLEQIMNSTGFDAKEATKASQMEKSGDRREYYSRSLSLLGSIDKKLGGIRGTNETDSVHTRRSQGLKRIPKEE